MIQRLGRLKIGQKLILCFLALGVLPALIIGLFSLREASKGLENLAFQQLHAVREIKKAQLENYFADRQSDMDALVEVGGTLRQQALEKLTAIREVKQRTIENYFKNITSQIQTFSDNQILREAMVNFNDRVPTFRSLNNLEDAEMGPIREQLKRYYLEDFTARFEASNDGVILEGMEDAFSKLDNDTVALQYFYILQNPNSAGSREDMDAAQDLSSYTFAHQYVHPSIRGYKQKFGFADAYLIGLDGRVVYSSGKKLDYGTSLVDGPFAESGLAQAFNQAKAATQADFVAFSDFATYQPSYDAPAMFVATPVFNGEEMSGVLALQINSNTLNLTMAERTGLGNSGEVYLVGEDHLMRSDSNADPDRSLEASLKRPQTGAANSAAIEDALAGNKGSGVVVNYLGKPVLSAWTPIRVGDFNWALMADIDVTEALSPIDENWVAFYQKYAEIYGYKDLLLINPDGYIFYTSSNGEEARTNILNGDFSNTSLAKLVRSVISSKQPGIADFKPYAASNNEPAAFMAQPFVHDDKVEMVIVIRLPLSGINKIMGLREGMGESGQSYLVGPDMLMRSDSFKDPEARTVAASFKGTVADNGVDTLAVREALAGNSDTKIMQNYAGESVLSAYAPIKVGNTTWALLAEVDEKEAFATRESLTLLIFGVLAVSIGLIVVVGIILARQISRPVDSAAQLAEQVSSGDLTTEIAVDRSDEIGHLQESLKHMTEGLRVMVSDIGNSADQQASAAEELASITEQTRRHVTEQNQNTELVATAITQMSATVQEVSQNTAEAAEAAQLATEEVNRGNTEVNSAIEAIRTFAHEVEHMATNMRSVEQSAENIGGIIDVINGIADQTNLLALNAAIEAARAGDQGRGFAVVADEVRSLAQSTQNSTKQIEQMIGQLQQGARESGAAMARGHEQMDSVVRQAETTGEALSRINDAVERINAMNIQIASASDEQAAVAEDITRNVNQINELAHQTGADAEQISFASDELARLASDLQSHTRKFKM